MFGAPVVRGLGNFHLGRLSGHGLPHLLVDRFFLPHALMLAHPDPRLGRAPAQGCDEPTSKCQLAHCYPVSLFGHCPRASVSFPLDRRFIRPVASAMLPTQAGPARQPIARARPRAGPTENGLYDVGYAHRLNSVYTPAARCCAEVLIVSPEIRSPRFTGLSGFSSVPLLAAVWENVRALHGDTGEPDARA